jgi:hypothetical protein
MSSDVLKNDFVVVDNITKERKERVLCNLFYEFKSLVKIGKREKSQHILQYTEILMAI